MEQQQGGSVALAPTPLAGLELCGNNTLASTGRGSLAYHVHKADSYAKALRLQDLGGVGAALHDRVVGRRVLDQLQAYEPPSTLVKVMHINLDQQLTTATVFIDGKERLCVQVPPLRPRELPARRGQDSW